MHTVTVMSDCSVKYTISQSHIIRYLFGCVWLGHFRFSQRSSTSTDCPRVAAALAGRWLPPQSHGP